ncbi:iron complex outermembrane receptor protein [Caulobacter ginsengisoli]|uniref:Iron complex outermembrane receptor protein n=1 Tax=Caulobacter ginsengisoli TaxID=400775 RepID=A0ABU0J0S8_9CAUL|nr:TonB-dependent receptor [Caulobacter ginsengisoli]MDQ0466904.1 iron complex outermembrane receptor protein [Caulobacter ginsengisoli]
MSRKTQLKYGMLCGGATMALVMGLGLPALAADAEPKPADATVSEVIVTATKREEALSKVPVAVSAYSGDQIQAERITNFDSLSSAAPGPTFVPISGASGSQVQMRGLYASDDSPAFDTPVGVFIDDVYYGSVASFYPDFFDVQQIAVLRGPQGTTFGRNTVGGALQITSNKPSFDGFSGVTNLTVRNFNGLEGDGYFNAAFSDSLAGRFAFGFKDVDGYQHNITNDTNLNDKKVWSARASLRFRPTDDLDVLASLTYTHEDSNGDGPVLYGQGALIASLKAISNDPHDVFVDDDGQTKRNVYNGFIRVDWDNPLGTFTSISAYRRLNSLYVEDIDGSPLRIAPDKDDHNREKQFSQEFRLTSPSGQPLEWIAGLYFLKQSTFRSETYTFGGLGPWRINTLTAGATQRPTISGDIDTFSYAPFAELKWNINDQWALTFGARYTHDEKKNHTVQGPASVFFGAAKDVKSEETWNAVTPRAILAFKPNEDLFFYASASTGFKSGGYNYAAATVIQATTPLLPEKNVTYELGAKTFFFDRRLSVNLALYKSNTKDLQVRSLVGATLMSTNAGEAETKGLELEVAAKPFDGANIGFNYAYTDATYASFKGCAAGGVDCTGNQIPFTPRNALNVFAQYTWDLDSGGSFTARVEDRWASHYELTPQNNLFLIRDKTARNGWINAFLTYEPAEGNWKVQAWGRNLADKTAVTFGTNYFFYLLTNTEATVGGLTEADRTSVTEPRTYGVTLTYRFQ